MKKFLAVLTDQLADQIISKMAVGRRVKDIAEDVGVTIETIYQWERENRAGFRDQMNEARRMWANILQEECLEIADTCPMNAVAVSRATLQIKTRLQIYALLRPARAEAPILRDDDSDSVSPVQYLREWQSKNTAVQ